MAELLVEAFGQVADPSAHLHPYIALAGGWGLHGEANRSLKCWLRQLLRKAIAVVGDRCQVPAGV